MIYKLQAPFKSGQAGRLRVKDGICQTDDPKLVAELTQAPHNFVVLEQIDELAKAESKRGAKGDQGKGSSANEQE